MGDSPRTTPVHVVKCVAVIAILVFICTIREVILFICGLVGIRIWSQEEDNSFQYPPEWDDWDEWDEYPSEKYMTDVLGQMQSVRYEALSGGEQQERECVVCLTEFEPDVEINKLCCGHFFHKMCLEKWLKCWKVTCPICRSNVVNRPNNVLDFEALGLF